MRTELFDYDLPPELIAQTPLPRRQDSRLLVVRRPTLSPAHSSVAQLAGFVGERDLLVLNNSRVIPARLRGSRKGGGKFEILLLEEIRPNEWWTLLKPGRRTPAGSSLFFEDQNGEISSVAGTVLEKNQEGHCRIRFEGTGNILNEIEELGEIPLPPYIERPSHNLDEVDRERYQTVYASPRGSVAAPTAGLHFTKEMLERIPHVEVTLHVGLGTFAPVKADEIEEHRMHEERFEVTPQAAERIMHTKRSGGKIFAAGTTSLRVLESVAESNEGQIVAGQGKTSIFIYPPHKFRCVDALLTNFHLPKSTLLMLVSAFAAPGSLEGIQRMKALYQEAIERRYRFFSYGDAMLIL